MGAQRVLAATLVLPRVLWLWLLLAFAPANASADLARMETALRDLVASRGGWVSPALRVASFAGGGGRGVVAVAAVVGGEELLRLPLSASLGHMTLPAVRRLYVDAVQSDEDGDDGGGGCRLDAQALALAQWLLQQQHHQQRGKPQTSPHASYLASLPVRRAPVEMPQPACPARVRRRMAIEAAYKGAPCSCASGLFPRCFLLALVLP